MRRQPLIAIPTYHLPAGEIGRWGRGGYALPTPYVDAVTRAGGIAVLLPSRPDVDVAAALEPFDGLLLPGGGDIDPARFGQAPHPSVYGVDENRDAFELAAVEELVRRRMPALAICRGMQIVDVAHGGTLIQHVPEHPHLEPHGVPGGVPGGGQSARHSVRIEADTRLHAAVGRPADGCVASCTSWHHQAVDAIGAGLRPVGWSDDGLVEALEPADPSAPWMVAVQWHPETSAHKDPVQQALFDAFVAECRNG